MTDLVPWSASAQATETDFDGLKVRSKPATGKPPRGDFGAAPTGSPLIGSAQATSMFSRCASVTSEPRRTPRPPSRPESPAPRNTPGGVPEDA
jgi:hypothetical protein